MSRVGIHTFWKCPSPSDTSPLVIGKNSNTTIKLSDSRETTSVHSVTEQSPSNMD